jgi:hypothetical protein
MTTPRYKLSDETPLLDDAYIIVERPHRGPEKIWSVFDSEQLCVMADRQNPDITRPVNNVQEAFDILTGDLQTLTLWRYDDPDLLTAVESDPVLAREALRLGWISE